MDRDLLCPNFLLTRDMKELCLKYGIVACPKSEPTKQMVSIKRRNPPVKAHLPQLLSCLVLLPCIQTCPLIWEHPLHKSQVEYAP